MIESDFNKSPPIRILLKEGLLLRAVIGNNEKPQSWEKRLFALHSTGDLEEFSGDNATIDKTCPSSHTRLQDFVRLFDGKEELGEDICFGLKSLKETVYFKAITKAEYELWWKELSSFVPAPIKRTASSSSSLKSAIGGVFSKPSQGKQFASPSALLSSKPSTRSSRSYSVSYIQDKLEHTPLEALRNRVAKLEEENGKLAKAESERRKMEVEVNYWREYVANTHGSFDAGKELLDARCQVIHLQDDLNENQRKLRHVSGKLLLQSKDLNDTKEKLLEANKIIAVHKAKVDQLTKEILNIQQRQEHPYADGDDSVLFFGEPTQAGDGDKSKLESRGDCPDQFDRSSDATCARHLEDKFLVLKYRHKRIEKELFLKSKELKKANESRSNVTKYTRSLLQELEIRLSDALSQLSAAEDKLAHTNMELEMERERRKKLEESAGVFRRRSSSIVRPATGSGAMTIDTVTPVEFTEEDVNSKYADYYRSRFKEVEASLMEKDIKLNGAVEKVKDLQNQLRNTSEHYKIIEDLQLKLSDATLKLSDRQLKIHELQRRLETSKGFEESYDRISNEHESTKRSLRQCEDLSSESKSRKLQELQQDQEIFEISEAVMKKQIKACEDKDAVILDRDEAENKVLQKSFDALGCMESVIKLEARREELEGENCQIECIKELKSQPAYLKGKDYLAQYLELSQRFAVSEQNVIDLASALERRLIDGDERRLSLRDVHGTIDKLEALDMRLSEIQMQLMEASSPLQVKADELQRERTNVIRLAEATSAYIQELENTVAQSKARIDELQHAIELRGGEICRRLPESGYLCKETVRVAPCDADTECKDDTDHGKSFQNSFSAMVVNLQPDISEPNATHALESPELKGHQMLVDTPSCQLCNAGISSRTDEMAARIEELENLLENARANYTNDVELLRARFHEELRAAFNGHAGALDLLNRIHDLELELHETHKAHASKIKEVQEAFEEEKEQMRDDLAMVLQASLSVDFAEHHSESDDKPQSAVVEALEEKIIKLEQELKAMEEKHLEDMEIEQEAHQRDMEDTIRDMLTVRESAAQYSYDNLQDPGRRSENRRGSSGSVRTYTVEEVEEIRCDYEHLLAEKDEEHSAEMQQTRQDFAIVIASIQAGNTSETILELTTRIKELEQDLEECKADFQLEVEDLSLKLKRADSANFFGLRRNEEMGAKIYQMQNDMEEMDRKHKLELEAYRESLQEGSDSKHLDELILENQSLKDRKNELEGELEAVRRKHLDEMEVHTIRLQEEKRASVEEMTDEVLKLESLIEEIKAEHEVSIKAFEKQAREEKSEAVSKERDKCKDLENKLESAKRFHEIEIQDLRAGQKKEASKFYEKDRFKPSGEGSIFSLRSVSHINDVAELEERHANEIKELKESFALERQKMEETLQNQINSLRNEYDEKLKCAVKEGMRRQSFSDRQSDASRMRELVISNESLKAKLLDLEIKYEDEVRNYKEAMRSYEKIIAELKATGSRQCVSHTNSAYADLPESQSMLEVEKLEEQRKIKEIADQIDRYQRRIEYYKDKAEREGRVQSHRVDELQAEIVQLQKELKSFEKEDKRETEDSDKLVPRPLSRVMLDRSAPRRHTDSFDGVERPTRLRESRKRWSNLEERSEKEDIGRSGSVLARKVLWENINMDDLNVKPAVSKTPLARTTSCSTK